MVRWSGRREEDTREGEETWQYDKYSYTSFDDMISSEDVLVSIDDVLVSIGQDQVVYKSKKTIYRPTVQTQILGCG